MEENICEVFGLVSGAIYGGAIKEKREGKTKIFRVFLKRVLGSEFGALICADIDDCDLI